MAGASARLLRAAAQDGRLSGVFLQICSNGNTRAQLFQRFIQLIAQLFLIHSRILWSLSDVKLPDRETAQPLTGGIDDLSMTLAVSSSVNSIGKSQYQHLLLFVGQMQQSGPQVMIAKIDVSNGLQHLIPARFSWSSRLSPASVFWRR